MRTPEFTLDLAGTVPEFVIAKPCQRGRAGTRVPTMSGETGRVTRPA